MWSGPLVCINLKVISLWFDCPTVPCCVCSVCSVHSLTGLAEILCTGTCSLSLLTGISFAFTEFTMSEISADMPARFIAAVYLLPNSEQNFLRFLVTFLSLDIPETCPILWTALHLEFPPLLPVTNLSQGSEGFAGSWGSWCFLSLFLHASAGKAQLPTASGSMQPHWDPKLSFPLGQDWVSSPVHTDSAAPWLSSGWLPAHLGSHQPAGPLALNSVQRILAKDRSKERRSWGWDSRRRLNTFPPGNVFWHRADSEIPEYIICLMPLPTSAKIQSLKPFKKASMHNLIKLLVCKEEKSYTHYW